MNIKDKFWDYISRWWGIPLFWILLVLLSVIIVLVTNESILKPVLKTNIGSYFLGAGFGSSLFFVKILYDNSFFIGISFYIFFIISYILIIFNKYKRNIILKKTIIVLLTWMLLSIIGLIFFSFTFRFTGSL